MSSPFATIPDLFDDRYLSRAQDVTGHIQPLPTLVPYDEYAHNVLVYKVDGDHSQFLALLQNNISRTSQQFGKELWAWMVQWRIEDSPHANATIHTPKRQRVGGEAPRAVAIPAPQQRQPQKPMLTVSRRVLQPDLMEEEDLLRVLIDIVQVRPAHVPNFIEFLYRWVDWYEGVDGKALQLAIRREIPSLWEFEYHPKPSPEVDCEASVREKPELAELERRAAMSERMKYREVRFGLHGAHELDKKDDTLPELINMPPANDTLRHNRYLAACFRNRELAKRLLLEQGVTVHQINNYIKCQTIHPKETPEQGFQGHGLDHYLNEQKPAQQAYMERQKWEKSKEAQLNDRLGKEAQEQEARNAALVAEKTTTELSHPVFQPLIPPTPTHPPSRTFPRNTVRRRYPDDPIFTVPAHMSKLLKSKPSKYSVPEEDFGEDGDSESLIAEILSYQEEFDEEEEEEAEEEDDGDEEEEREEEHEEGDGMNGIPQPNGRPVSQTALAMPPPPALAEPQNQTYTPAQIMGYFGNLTPRQLMPMLPTMNGSNRQAILQVLLAMPQTSGLDMSLNALAAANDDEEEEDDDDDESSENADVVDFDEMDTDHDDDGDIADQDETEPVGPLHLAMRAHQGQPLMPAAGNTAHTLPAITVTSSPPVHNSQYSAMHPQSQLQGTYQNAPNNTPYVGFIPRSTLPRPDPRLQIPPTMPLRNLPLHNPQTPIPGLLPPEELDREYERLRLHGPRSGHTPILPLSLRALNNGLSGGLLPSNRAQPGFAASRAGMTRTVPPALNLQAAISPSARVSNGIPIHIYCRGIVQHPSNLSADPKGHPCLGARPSDSDAIMLGYMIPPSDADGEWEIKLETLIMLPICLWQNYLSRVRQHRWEPMETYPVPKSHPTNFGRSPSVSLYSTNTPQPNPHKHVYNKVAQAFALMAAHTDRENELTKRWRSTQGPMTEVGRGSVWEGWGVNVDKGIGLSEKEREGVFRVGRGFGDKKVDEEEERRNREIEEMIEMEDWSEDEEE